MLSNLEIIEWKKFRGQPKLEDAVGRVQFGIFWIQIFPNWTSRVNPILSARLLSFNFYELFSKGLIWTVSERAFLYKFKKNRTAGLSQSNARKYNRQCNLANQHKVPVTIQTFISLVIHFPLLLNGPEKKPKENSTTEQENKTTFTATKSQECSRTNRCQPTKLFLARCHRDLALIG